ncbi:MAG TPA: tetratricopeptide repeat protein [Lacipirellulaceae bacterium]|nr:tetratricopeptide repeat protein [Lacipirellulaceae bacterium]
MNTLSTMLTASLTLAVLASGASAPAAESIDDYFDIGDFHCPVSTTSPQAQLWFDRGLAMCFGFNHEEAVRCFERAHQADPRLAMALWGMAYAWGPNINNMDIDAQQMAQAALAVRLAELREAEASDLERALIAALSQRYPFPVPDLDARAPLNDAYADAMRDVSRQHPDSSLAAALLAEALMNLEPWMHWTPQGQPGRHTPEILEILEAGLDRWPDHPMLCHLYIHAVEASPHPEKALPAANRLRNLMPGVGHLVHMPSHIDVLMGDYNEVIPANQRGIDADKVFLAREGPYNLYTLYRIHNYHFLVYGAMFDGRSELALSAAREIAQQVPEEMLREQVDFIDAFIPTPLHVLVRFGRWDEILQEPEPPNYLPMSCSIWHYARGLAYAATGRVAEAEAEQARFAAVSIQVPETSFLFQNSSRSILGVAEAMLAGEIAYRRGEFAAAFAQREEAVRRDDALNYDEPWGWMQPARHALGALLLEQGRAAEAEAVYRADLQRHPNNPWALHGLAESLVRQGQAAEARLVQGQFDAAMDDADVPIDRSCFCRLGQAE